MASVRRSPRPRLFETELRETEPTSPVFFLAFAFTVGTVMWVVQHPQHLLQSGVAIFGLIATLLWAPVGTWHNPVAWERRWRSSRFAARQKRLEAHTRRLIGLTALYAVAFSSVAVSLFVVGLFVAMPAPLVFLVVGGLIVTVFLTLPVCLAAGVSSGALLPSSWREDEPARVESVIDWLTSPRVRAHTDCAALGAALAAFVLGLLALGA